VNHDHVPVGGAYSGISDQQHNELEHRNAPLHNDILTVFWVSEGPGIKTISPYDLRQSPTGVAASPLLRFNRRMAKNTV
jgi:hypothetical protein